MEDEGRGLEIGGIKNRRSPHIKVHGFPGDIPQVIFRVSGNIGLPVEADQVGHPGAQGCDLEPVRLGDDPGRHVSAVAPPHDPKLRRVGDLAVDQGVDPGHDVPVVAAAPIQEVGLPELIAVAIASPGIGHENGVPQARQNVERVAFGLDRIGRADLGRELGREPARGAAVGIGEHGIRFSRRRSRGKEKKPFDFEAVEAFPVDNLLPSQADVLELGVREGEPKRVEFFQSGNENLGWGRGVRAEEGHSLAVRRETEITPEKIALEERLRLPTVWGNGEELVSEARGTLKEDPAAVGGPLRREHEFVEFRGEVARRPALRGDNAEIPVGDPLCFPVGRKESDLFSVRREAGESVDAGPHDQVPDRLRLEVDRENIRPKKVLDARGRLGREGDFFPVGRP